ncbi:hypothetical protein JCM5296_003277 [Sporobolomyces johnsonii]
MSQFSPTYQQLLNKVLQVQQWGSTVPSRSQQEQDDISKALVWMTDQIDGQLTQENWYALQFVRAWREGDEQHLRFYSYTNEIADDLERLLNVLKRNDGDAVTRDEVHTDEGRMAAAVGHHHSFRSLGKPVACLSARTAERYRTTPEMWAARLERRTRQF